MSVSDSDYDNYSLEVLENKFLTHHLEFLEGVEKAKKDYLKYFPEDTEYRPCEFSLSKALSVLTQEIRKLNDNYKIAMGKHDFPASNKSTSYPEG